MDCERVVVVTQHVSFNHLNIWHVSTTICWSTRFTKKQVGRWSNSPYMLFFFPWNQNGLKLQTRSVVVRSQSTVNMTLCEWCGWDEFRILVYILNCKLGLSFWACFARHSFPSSLVWGYLSRGSTDFALWKCYETATDSCVCWQLRTSSSAGAMTTPWPRNRLYAPQVFAKFRSFGDHQTLQWLR